MKRLGLFLVLPLLVACKNEAEPKGEKAKPTATAKTGEVVAAPVEDACAEYAKTLEACVAKLPEGPQRTDLERMRSQHDAAWKAASEPARQQMASGCQMGLATLRQDGRCD